MEGPGTFPPVWHPGMGWQYRVGMEKTVWFESVWRFIVIVIVLLYCLSGLWWPVHCGENIQGFVDYE